jgi:hypothetical protein
LAPTSPAPTPSGRTLAQATQIKPLNDVDVVVRTPHAPQSWIDNPLQAMLDVKSWIENDIRGVYELSTHAIKITFADEEFTADVVVGVKREGKGIHLPHCPKDEPQRWIESDPAGDPESQGLATPESDSRNGRATAPGRRDRRTG